MPVIILPKPDTAGGLPLMQALARRRTTRAFSAKTLGGQLTGDLLWAAWGVNREDGRRTAPSALNSQDVVLYALRADGVWRYDAASHSLTQTVPDDLRAGLGQSGFVAQAPLTVVCVLDTRKNRAERFGYVHAGEIVQNIGLFCASAGLANVVRASFEADSVGRAMRLPASERILLMQSVGWQG